MKALSRPVLIAVSAAVLILACALWFLVQRPGKSTPQVLSDTQINNPDAVIDIHVREFKVVNPSTTTFRVKHGSVNKLRFFVEGDEEQIHLTGNGVDINTESDETSALPGSIFVGGLAAGTYELAAYADTQDNLSPTAAEKHILGRVEVVK
jgi:hypothetical protein